MHLGVNEAVAYLRESAGDAEQYAPSLFKSKGKRTRKGKKGGDATLGGLSELGALA